jgi:acyl CoA:acetate/3-ketoacid CoA transferase beta subunit
MTMDATRADVCVVACAEAFRGDDDRVVSPMGTVPRLGALVAMATFAPDLLLTDGEAYLLAGPLPLGAEGSAPKEGWLPFRDVFQVVNAGTRHVMMGASQIDRHGNQNISAIGDWKQPKVQLLGARGAPGNTVNHTTSYWIAGHSPRVFVDHVDFVSGVGTDRAAGVAGEHHDLRAVITDLAVLDLGGPDATMRLRSVHPGVSIDDVTAATGFPLDVPDDVPTTPAPTAEQLALIDRFDPRGARFREVPHD